MSKEVIKLAIMNAAPLLYQSGHKEESAACNAALLMLLAEQPAQQQERPSFAEWTSNYVRDNLHKLKPAQQEPTKAMIDAAERIDWSDSDVRGNIVNMWQAMLAAAPQPAQQQGILARKWILHGGFADVASFDADGFPSFYWKESVAKFKAGELSAPCKGKNCGSLNGWLHSAECRAEHEAHYTAPQQTQQEPVAWMKPHPNCDSACLFQCTHGFTQFPECAAAPQPAQQKVPETKDVVIDNMGKPFTVKAYVTPQPAQQQEPGRNHWEDGDVFERIAAANTAPQSQRTWVGLTQQEVQEIHDTYHKRMGPQEFAAMVEAKLKVKNT